MGLFGFGKKEASNVNWIQLTELQTLEEIKAKSFDKPQVIFKHSTRCSISSMSLNRVESKFDLITDKVDAYYLDLISFREISNQIAHQFNVTHQSPQVLLIINGECVYNASHSSINVEEVLKTIS